MTDIGSFLQESSNCGATRASMKLESHHSYYSLGENCWWSYVIESDIEVESAVKVLNRWPPSIHGLHERPSRTMEPVIHHS